MRGAASDDRVEARGDERWPPDDLSPDEPVPIRRALRRIRDDLAASPSDATAWHVLEQLHDQTLPGVLARQGRSFWVWLRETRRVKLVAAWSLFTVGLVAASVLPLVFDGQPARILVVPAASAAMAAWWGALGWVSYAGDRYHLTQLADQIREETEELHAQACPAPSCEHLQVSLPESGRTGSGGQAG